MEFCQLRASLLFHVNFLIFAFQNQCNIVFSIPNVSCLQLNVILNLPLYSSLNQDTVFGHTETHILSYSLPHSILSSPHHQSLHPVIPYLISSFLSSLHSSLPLSISPFLLPSFPPSLSP